VLVFRKRFDEIAIARLGEWVGGDQRATGALGCGELGAAHPEPDAGDAVERADAHVLEFPARVVDPRRIVAREQLTRRGVQCHACRCPAARPVAESDRGLGAVQALPCRLDVE
jgi:hypothetical protein